MSEPPEKLRIGVVMPVSRREELFTAAQMTQLEQLGEVIWSDTPDKVEPDEAIRILQGCNVGVGSWGTPYPDAALVEACPDLRLWVHAAGTVKRFFGPHLDGRDLTIVSCKGAIADSVAEFTLGVILIGARGAFQDEVGNHHGLRLRARAIMAESSVAIVGASEVGRRVIDLIRPFGCRTLLYDPTLSEHQAAEMGVTLHDDLPAMCAQADVVSVHTPDIPATHRLLNAACFQTMPDHAVFINTARAGCIDQDALITELKKDRLFACLDVTEPEPLPPDHELRRMENVFLTSHLAGPHATNIGARAIADIKAWSRGESPQCVVTADMLSTTA